MSDMNWMCPCLMVSRRYGECLLHRSVDPGPGDQFLGVLELVCLLQSVIPDLLIQKSAWLERLHRRVIDPLDWKYSYPVLQQERSALQCTRMCRV